MNTSNTLNILGRFACMPKFTFMCAEQSNIYHYIPMARHLAKKIIAGIFVLLGISIFACSVLATSMCQTFMPCIGLFVLSMLLFVFAYCHYVKAWMRLEIPQWQFGKHTVSGISEKEYHSLLYTWRFTSLGSYCHRQNKNVHICEGTREKLREVLASRAEQKNGVFLIQELDLEALHQHQLEIETQYQNIFEIPPEIRRDVDSVLETVTSAPQVMAVPWSENSIHSPQEVIYTNIPRNTEEGELAQISAYTEAYTRAFIEAIQRASSSHIISKQGICLLVPPLGVVKGESPEKTRMMKILSKIAFLQATEFLATEAVLPEDKKHLSITVVLIDHLSIAPLRAIDTPLVCSLVEQSICFADLMSSSS